MHRLTKRSVELLAIKAKDYIVFDADVTGFGVRILPSGKKSYLVQYRSGGRTRRIAIGKHGTVTADQARTRARELLGAVAGGDNPAEEISTTRAAPSVSIVCDRFIRDYVEDRCKPKTQRDYRRVIDAYVKPNLGPFRIIDVTRADIADLHHRMRSKPYQANRTLAVLSKMFNLSELWGLRPDGSNPCRHVQKYKENKRDRFLLQGELQTLGAVLSRREADGVESSFVIAAFRLLILTGCRLGEIQFLKWSYVHGDTLHLPDSKTGARKIPISTAAQDVLQRLPQLPGNDFVIAGEVDGQPITDMQRPWRRIRKQAGLDNVRIHDLRHTYVSNAVMNGVPITIVKHLVGHADIQTTMRYAHLDDSPIRDAVQHVSTGLNSAISIKESVPPTGSIVTFKPRQSIRTT